MCTFLGFLQFKLCTTNYHLHTVLNEVCHHVVEIQELWTALYKSNAIHRETRLQCSIFVEFIEHYLCIGVTLDLDDDTHIAFGLITDTRDSFDLLIVHKVSDILHQIRFYHTIWQLTNHDTLAAIILGLNLCFRANNHTTTTCLVRIAHALVTIYSTTRWEVRRLDMLHKFCHGDWLYFGILHTCHSVLHIGHTTVNHLAQVVGRHIGCHTYCNTTSTIHQQVRETTW